ncbi:MAG: dockerin type I domain-containing protein [Phycisphaerales bacterium]
MTTANAWMPTVLRLAFVGGVLGAASTASAAIAGDPPVIDWLGGDGDFIDPAQWAGGIGPGPEDIARFATRGTTSVQFLGLPEPAVVRGIWLERGRTELRGDPFTDLDIQAISPSSFNPSVLIAGPDGPESITSLFGFALEATSMTIGQGGIGPGGHGEGGITDFTISGRLAIGDGAPGYFRSRGTLSAGFAEFGRGAYGEIDFQGGGNLFIDGPLQIGSSGLAIVVNADETTADQLNLGGTPMGNGSLTTDTLDVTSGVDVGVLGEGEVILSEPSTVGGSVVLGASVDLESMAIRGEGRLRTGSLNIGEDLIIGLLGVGHLEVRPGATVDVAGEIRTFFADPNDTSSVTIELGAGNGPPALRAGGQIILPGITVIGGAAGSFAPGDAWTLADAGTSLQYGSLSLPALPGDLQWTVNDASNDLTITVIDAGAPGPGDANGDGTVDFGDILAVIEAFGPCPAGVPCPADFNGDGMVTTFDLLTVLANWAG